MLAMNRTTSPFSAVTLMEQPHPLLQSFVSHYVFRDIRFPKGYTLEKAMPLRINSSIDFFIGDGYDTVDCSTGQPVSFCRSTVRGLRTRKLYSIRLKGHFVSFSIKLKPVGLYRLTGLPMDLFTDQSVPDTDLPGLPLGKIAGKLEGTTDMAGCIRIVEPYLLTLAAKSGQRSCRSEPAISMLSAAFEPLSVPELASESYLSQRQLERVFRKEIGVSPKTLCRMHRFRRLIQKRINEPVLKWTTMAYQFGYYDQMHMIKDFRQFLDVTPSSFEPANFAF